LEMVLGGFLATGGSGSGAGGSTGGGGVMRLTIMGLGGFLGVSAGADCTTCHNSTICSAITANKMGTDLTAWII
jgi:hypothetical protein